MHRQSNIENRIGNYKKKGLKIKVTFCAHCYYTYRTFMSNVDLHNAHILKSFESLDLIKKIFLKKLIYKHEVKMFLL